LHGCVYVFNDAKKAAAFEQGGEMGTGLTRVGAGPNGETVVADSEQALELFFFKHGISQVVEHPSTAPSKVEWRDGKTRFTLGDNFYLELSNRVQLRFTREMPDATVTLPGTGGPGDAKGSFTIPRAKFKLEGWFYKPQLEYELQLNWPDVAETPASRLLEDAYIDWDVSKQKKFRIRFGQFKAPYGRQRLASSGALQFVDRAETDARYNPSRETGIALWGTLGGNRVDWRVMASNGNGRSQPANDNSKFLCTARVMWQAIGNAPMNEWGSGPLLTEADLADSASGALLAIAGNFLKNDRRFSSTTAVVNDDTQWSFDYTFKYEGFASVGEYHHRSSDPYLQGVAGPGFDDTGFGVQASYAWKGPAVVAGGGFWELAFRYSQIDPTDLVSTANDRTEIGGALSWYANRHNLKVQADFREIEDEAANSGEGAKNKEFRLQTQFMF
jgi:phosphate-selective porin OprO/OprP